MKARPRSDWICPKSTRSSSPRNLGRHFINSRFSGSSKNFSKLHPLSRREGGNSYLVILLPNHPLRSDLGWSAFNKSSHSFSGFLGQKQCFPDILIHTHTFTDSQPIIIFPGQSGEMFGGGGELLFGLEGLGQPVCLSPIIPNNIIYLSYFLK